MTLRRQSEPVRLAILVAWGMATLVLAFIVIILVYQMMQRGQMPLAVAVRNDRVDAADTAPDQLVETREVILYYSAPNTFGLLGERRRIPYSNSTVGNCRNALNALIEGPEGALGRVITPQANLRGMYLTGNGDLLIDFSRTAETSRVKSAAADLLMIQAIALTLAEPALRGNDGPDVRRIQLLFEGSPATDSVGSHIAMGEPVIPDRSLVHSREQAGADG